MNCRSPQRLCLFVLIAVLIASAAMGTGRDGTTPAAAGGALRLPLPAPYAQLHDIQPRPMNHLDFSVWLLHRAADATVDAAARRQAIQAGERAVRHLRRWRACLRQEQGTLRLLASLAAPSAADAPAPVRPAAASGAQLATAAKSGSKQPAGRVQPG